MGDGTSYYRKCYEEIFNDCYPCFRNNNIISEAGVAIIIIALLLACYMSLLHVTFFEHLFVMWWNF